jgi:Holin of 3TMs, for gene-transfer release
VSLTIPILDGVFKVIDKLIPDPEQKAKLKLDTLRLQQEGAFKELDADLQIMLAQVGVNTVEAASPDSFRGGWRPAIGWICAAGLAWTYVLHPMVGWLATTRGLPMPPSIDTFDLLILLGGMLGFGGMRSFERIRGKA